MEDIKYINLVEIGPVVFELREVEISNFLVRVNNTHVSCTTFLAAWHTTMCLNPGILNISQSISMAHQSIDISKFRVCHLHYTMRI